MSSHNFISYLKGLTESFEKHSLYPQHPPELLDVQKFLVVLVDPVSQTAPGSLSSQRGSCPCDPSPHYLTSGRFFRTCSLFP